MRFSTSKVDRAVMGGGGELDERDPTFWSRRTHDEPGRRKRNGRHLGLSPQTPRSVYHG